jgi:hypothetical protein
VGRGLTMTVAVRRYSLFGLDIASEISLPELPELEEIALRKPDVFIRESPVAPLVSGCGGVEAVGGGITLAIAEIARYHVREGAEIVVEAALDADPNNVRLFLLGSAFGILIHQRGLFPLHANAVEIGQEAVAFTGESGAGKSTLAAWFHDCGSRIVADDVCVISVEKNHTPLALPGLPRFRLWREALERSGRDARDHPRSFIGDDGFDKYDVAAAPAGVVKRPLPLRAVYLLERGSSFAIEKIHGVAAAEILFANTYRGAMLSLVGAQAVHWRIVLSLLERVPVYRFIRRWDLAAMADENAALFESLKNTT